jgi:hypothetical protein
MWRAAQKFARRFVIMCRKTRLLLSLIISIAIFGIKPELGTACTCIIPKSAAIGLRASTAVFSGKVMGINIPKRRISSADPVKVLFRVNTVWKGPEQAVLIVTTAREGASCGYHFEHGVEYLVYAGGEMKALRVSKCSRTQPLPYASTDLAELGEGSAPPKSPWVLRMLGFGAVLAAAIFMVVR